MKLDFNTPNSKTLTHIDWFMQHSSRERRWERSGVTDYYTGGEGWDGVEKNDPTSFKKAWYSALNYVHSNEFDVEEIKNYQGE
jgi:hypothetical protein